MAADGSDLTFRGEDPVLELVQSVDSLLLSPTVRAGLLVLGKKLKHDIAIDLQQGCLEHRVGESGKVDPFDLPHRTFVVFDNLVEPNFFDHSCAGYRVLWCIYGVYSLCAPALLVSHPN